MRGSLVESLCSNFAVLNPSITAISHSSGECTEDAAYLLQQMQSHLNALKIYSYFLHSILVVEEAAEAEPATKAPSGKVCHLPSQVFPHELKRQRAGFAVKDCSQVGVRLIIQQCHGGVKECIFFLSHPNLSTSVGLNWCRATYFL